MFVMGPQYADPCVTGGFPEKISATDLRVPAGVECARGYGGVVIRGCLGTAASGGDVRGAEWTSCVAGGSLPGAIASEGKPLKISRADLLGVAVRQGAPRTSAGPVSWVGTVVHVEKRV